jgi:serine/threonine protein kinase
VRIERLPDPQASEVARLASELPLPPLLEPRRVFDGYRIVRELHASSRSHIYLATDEAGGEPVVIKTPSTDLRGDAAYLERFLLEEWIARRIDSPHVLKPRPARARSFLYVVFEYVEGCTLAQWMLDHPRADIALVRGLVEQAARGLRAFHRLEMLHHDLRPENIMVDAIGTVKLIDFGAVRVAGLVEMAPQRDEDMLGALGCTAPERFLGQPGSAASDQFSLAVITYQMLTGRLPYGAEIAKCSSLAEQRRLRYLSAQQAQPRLPGWVDDAIRKAVDPEPQRRYGDVDEFVAALQRPDPAFTRSDRLPLVARHPVLFWQALSALLAVACVVLLALLVRP